MAVAAVAVLLVAVLAVLNRDSLSACVGSTAGADKEWVSLAVVGTVLLWVSGTMTQLGAISIRPSFSRVLAVQIAASFANHVLPAGSGGIAVNVRFLRKLGMTRESALAAQALSSTVGLINHMLLLMAALALAPRASQRLGVHLPEVPAMTTVVGVLGCIGLGLVLAVVLRRGLATRRRLARALGVLRAEALALRRVLRDPRRAAELWLGSVSAPLLHSLILVFVLRALSCPMSAGLVLLVYLAASAVSGLVPSPGAIGALDVTLSAGLVAAGAPTPSALAAVLIYRLVTVWGPLVPGACVLGVLVRRKLV